LRIAETGFLLQTGCPSCHPSDSVKAEKGYIYAIGVTDNSYIIFHITKPA